MRVLIADDSEVFRNAAAAVVAATEGFDVQCVASCGEEAVALAAATAPDLALIDVSMPGIGGLEAARRIRGACPETVVVLMTADSGTAAAATVGVTASAVMDKRSLMPAALAALWREHGPR